VGITGPIAAHSKGTDAGVAQGFNVAAAHSSVTIESSARLVVIDSSSMPTIYTTCNVLHKAVQGRLHVDIHIHGGGSARVPNSDTPLGSKSVICILSPRPNQLPKSKSKLGPGFWGRDDPNVAFSVTGAITCRSAVSIVAVSALASVSSEVMSDSLSFSSASKLSSSASSSVCVVEAIAAAYPT
jgi:hypothetical protein